MTTLIISAAVHGMTCAPEATEKLFSKADFIFAGKVVERQKLREQPGGLCWMDGDKCGAKIATMKVGKVWKGTPGERITVYSEDACYCLGTYFDVGKKYLVFGVNSQDDAYSVKDLGACATDLYRYAKREKRIKELNKLKKAGE